MNSTNEQLISAIESAINEGLSKFETQDQVKTLSDLYLYFDEENMSLSVFDDMENQLVEVELDGFSESFGQSHEDELLAAAKIAADRLNKADSFNKDYILKPFSVSLVDSDFIISEELVFVDDETLRISDSLLAGLDKELNDFFKELMK